MRHFATVVCLCALLINSALGQGDRGTITGTVTDPTGAVIAGARVTAHNTDTRNLVETVTTGTGNFTLPQLPVGAWDVAVEAAGFKKFTSLKNKIEVAQTIRIDATLEVGSTTETIAVEANVVAIRTESADVTTTVSKELFVELPIQWSNGFYGNQAVRNPLSVAQLHPLAAYRRRGQDLATRRALRVRLRRRAALHLALLVRVELLDLVGEVLLDDSTLQLHRRRHLALFS